LATGACYLFTRGSGGLPTRRTQRVPCQPAPQLLPNSVRGKTKWHWALMPASTAISWPEGRWSRRASAFRRKP
jgi:hypothetical protein